RRAGKRIPTRGPRRTGRRRSTSRRFEFRAFPRRLDLPQLLNANEKRMSSDTMKLVLYHYWRSSSAWRVRFALHYKAIAYESVFVDLRSSQQLTADHKRIAPLGVVPVLLVDGRPHTESVANLEFVEEAFPQKPLLPSDRWLRARVRQLVEHVNSGIQPLQN